MPTVKQVIALSGEHAGWESYAAWRDRQEATDPMLAIDPEDVTAQFCTSGTTGHPKGVQLTHRSLPAVLTAVIEVLPTTPEDVLPATVSC